MEAALLVLTLFLPICGVTTNKRRGNNIRSHLSLLRISHICKLLKELSEASWCSPFLMDSEVKSAALSKPCVLIIGNRVQCHCFSPARYHLCIIFRIITFCVAVVAGVERFVYKGIASNIVTFLTDVVKMSTSSAAKIVSTWNGVTSMLPLASAILADSFWDRYSTITVSSLLYIAVSFFPVPGGYSNTTISTPLEQVYFRYSTPVVSVIVFW